MFGIFYYNVINLSKTNIDYRLIKAILKYRSAKLGKLPFVKQTQKLEPGKAMTQACLKGGRERGEAPLSIPPWGPAVFNGAPLLRKAKTRVRRVKLQALKLKK